MTFDLQRILDSKRAYRRRLASLPIGEKLRMLDMLRDRQLAIRGGSPSRGPAPTVVEEPWPAPPSKE